MKDVSWAIEACRTGAKRPTTDALRAALDDVARTPSGRVVLADVFCEGRLLEPTLSDDPYMSAAAEGMRRLATRLFNHLVAGPDPEPEAEEENDDE